VRRHRLCFSLTLTPWFVRRTFFSQFLALHCHVVYRKGLLVVVEGERISIGKEGVNGGVEDQGECQIFTSIILSSSRREFASYFFPHTSRKHVPGGRNGTHTVVVTILLRVVSRLRQAKRLENARKNTCWTRNGTPRYTTTVGGPV